jgi:hypothetical protein
MGIQLLSQVVVVLDGRLINNVGVRFLLFEFLKF